MWIQPPQQPLPEGSRSWWTQAHPQSRTHKLGANYSSYSSDSPPEGAWLHTKNQESHQQTEALSRGSLLPAVAWVSFLQKHFCIHLHKYMELFQCQVSPVKGRFWSVPLIQLTHPIKPKGTGFFWVIICLWASGLGEFGLQASLVFHLGAEVGFNINSHCSLWLCIFQRA